MGRDETVPRRLAEMQVEAYRQAFREEARRADEAERRRDFYRAFAEAVVAEMEESAGATAQAARARAARRMERVDFDAGCLP